MIIHSKSARFALVLGCLILLTACTRSLSNVDSQGKTTLPVFPDASNAVRSEGHFVNVDNLKQVKAGMTKTELYELLGVPHFKEGMFKVREWDYIFHFNRPSKTVITCQYKILFDSEMKARSFYFMPENCLDQLAVKNVVHQELKVEGLFAFNSTKLLPAGVKQIDTLTEGLNKNELMNKHIIISGHTDRIGRKDENLRLSLARAESVKQQMIANGIPASIIETRGMGDSEPHVSCAGDRSATLIDCLAPNRRISVDIVNLN